MKSTKTCESNSAESVLLLGWVLKIVHPSQVEWNSIRVKRRLRQPKWLEARGKSKHPKSFRHRLWKIQAKRNKENPF